MTVIRTTFARHLTLALATAVAMAACSHEAATVPKFGAGPAITVSPINVTVFVGDTARFTARDIGMTDTRVGWTTSATAVAVVDASGLVHAVSPGRALATVVSVSRPTLRAAAVVDVRARE